MRYHRHLLLPHSFLCQIRGTRDITNFLEKSEVLLDVREEELDSIVERLLDVMMQEKYGEAVSREELASLIFANPERTLLSEFVQGTIHKGMNQYEWEQVRKKAAHFSIRDEGVLLWSKFNP